MMCQCLKSPQTLGRFIMTKTAQLKHNIIFKQRPRAKAKYARLNYKELIIKINNTLQKLVISHDKIR